MQSRTDDSKIVESRTDNGKIVFTRTDEFYNYIHNKIEPTEVWRVEELIEDIRFRTTPESYIYEMIKEPRIIKGVIMKLCENGVIDKDVAVDIIKILVDKGVIADIEILEIFTKNVKVVREENKVEDEEDELEVFDDE